MSPAKLPGGGYLYSHCPATRHGVPIEMGFNPASGAYYHIIAKHSGKALSVRDKSRVRGALIEQRRLDPEEATQQFKFDAADAHRFFIKPRSADLYFDVVDASPHAGAAICQWTWNGNTANQRFQVITAGGGYYYIVAENSGKFLDVQAISKDDGAQLIQHDRQEAAHQMFRIIPSGQIYNEVDSLPFVFEDTADRLRDIVAGIAGTVPELGSALKNLVQFFWPQNAMTSVWAQMKEYINALVRELIAKERVVQLEQRLDGIRSNINDYMKTSYGTPQKGMWFTSVLSSLDDAESFFYDARDPQKTLPYFVALGTIKLTMLREQVLFYKEIYGVPDPDAAQHLKDFQAIIAKYKAAADKACTNALIWRLGLIRVDHSTTTSIGALGPTTNHIWAVIDDYDCTRQSWQYNTLSGGTYDAEQISTREFERLKAAVTAQYGADLDNYLAPAYLWPYFDMTKPDRPKRKPIVVTSGPFAGRNYTAFTDPGGSRITRVCVYGGSRVDGVEVFYDGKSAGVRGKVGGRTVCHVLKEGETIVAAYGRSGAVVDALFFETSRGHIVGVGDPRGGSRDWRADPPEGTAASLLNISGYHGSGHLEGISFHWQFFRDE